MPVRFSAEIGIDIKMAVRERFELSNGCPLHAFQACAFDHSATSPLRARIITQVKVVASAVRTAIDDSCDGLVRCQVQSCARGKYQGLHAVYTALEPPDNRDYRQRRYR
jgi:hypothetical protein